MYDGIPHRPGRDGEDEELLPAGLPNSPPAAVGVPASPPPVSQPGPPLSRLAARRRTEQLRDALDDVEEALVRLACRVRTAYRAPGPDVGRARLQQVGRLHA
ncbi:hypothetical protein JCM13580A_62220 [Streptomyces drozdowiczii]